MQKREAPFWGSCSAPFPLPFAQHFTNGFDENENLTLHGATFELLSNFKTSNKCSEYYLSFRGN